MNRTEKLKKYGKGIALIGLIGRVLLELYVRNGGSDFLNSDTELYFAGRIVFSLMVIIGYGMRMWADCREKETPASPKGDSKANES